MTNKLYSASGIRLGAFLGGPLAFGYLMYRNYRSLGLEKEARNTLWLSTCFSVILFGTLLSLRDDISDAIPNYIMPIILMGIGGEIVKRYQQSAIEKEIQGGDAVSISNWRAAGVALLWCFLTLILLIVCVLSFDL